MSTEKLQNALNAVPYLNHVEILVKAAAPGAVTLTLSGTGAVRDHANHIHSGAMFSLGEVAAGIAIGTHPDLTGLVAMQQASGIRYLKACPTTPFASAEIRKDQLQQIKEDFADNGQSKIEIIVPIEDGDGLRIAEVVSVFSLRNSSA